MLTAVWVQARYAYQSFKDRVFSKICVHSIREQKVLLCYGNQIKEDEMKGKYK